MRLKDLLIQADPENGGGSRKAQKQLRRLRTDPPAVNPNQKFYASFYDESMRMFYYGETVAKTEAEARRNISFRLKRDLIQDYKSVGWSMPHQSKELMRALKVTTDAELYNDSMSRKRAKQLIR